MILSIKRKRNLAKLFGQKEQRHGYYKRTYINNDICLFWCQNETYHRLCVILFWTWNACDVSDSKRFLWDFDHDRMYPAWILSVLWLLGEQMQLLKKDFQQK